MELGLNLVMVRPERHARDRGPGRGGRATARCSCPTTSCSRCGSRARTRTAPTGRSRSPLDTPLYDPWVVLSTDRGGDVDHQARHRGLRAPAAPPVRHRACGHLGSTSCPAGARSSVSAPGGWRRSSPRSGSTPSDGSRGLEECVEVLRALWTEEQPSYHGRHFDFDAVHFAPRPVSTPHPPILLGGDSDHALARAARIGDGWMSGGVSTDVGGDRGTGERPSGGCAATTVRPTRSRSPSCSRARRPTTSPGSRTSASTASW